MSDTVKAQETLHRIHDLGIDFAIDDYGTGYSSLAYLKKLPVDYLKIDKSFIMNVTKNDNDTMIVRSTIELVHNMGLKLIVEAVENQDSFDLLEILRCDFVQGYFISKPMPAQDVITWSKNWQAGPGIAPIGII
ncbi:MAG: EAL domain-containing protein (putative c-di-GMP-specific phosphodiesterase class I) [Planctomycetota bacterium]|jgi:EAL domain-containing protein (putative c-di-GMP-specific phosphodiesterase class I)